jgi:hypothetical protein
MTKHSNHGATISIMFGLTNLPVILWIAITTGIDLGIAIAVSAPVSFFAIAFGMFMMVGQRLRPAQQYLITRVMLVVSIVVSVISLVDSGRLTSLTWITISSCMVATLIAWIITSKRVG